MENELLPCPFCGGKAELRKWSNAVTPPSVHWQVKCLGCAAATPPIAEDEEEARGDWNRRSAREAEAGAVKVKPLEWEEFVRPPFQFAGGDYYFIGADCWGRHWVHHRVNGDLRGDDGKLAYYKSTDAAKAAAQADYERRILSALVSPAPHVAEGWRPIETAPKDGREILISCAGVGMLVRIGFWDVARGDVWSVWPGRQEMRPTHWMPLPAAPQIKEGEDK